MSAIKLSDTFTDADSTSLTSHTMDVGPGWTAGTGTFFVQGNKATPNSNANADYITTDAGVSDYQIDVDVVLRSGSGWESNANLQVRFQDHNNRWEVDMTASGGVIQLYEVAAGVVTQRISTAFAFISGTTYAITIVAQGSTISLFVNSVSKGSYSSAATAQTATKVGISTGQGGTVVTKCTWDNFLVRELVRFDAASNSGYQAAASSLSWSHNWQGSNRFLGIEVEMLSVNATVTAMTYGGAACTFIGAQTVAGGTGRVEMWRICQNDSGAPAAGSNTISVTLSGTLACAGTAVSRANVHQTTPIESFNSNSGINAGSATNATVVVTTATDNTVAQFGLATNDTSVTASGVSRNNVSGALGSGCDQDSDQITPPGSYTGTWTGEGITAAWAIAGYAIRPAGAGADPVGGASGAATVAGVGASQFSGVGASSGAATVAGVGAATAAGVGASSGSATVAGVGASIAAAVGSASGQATVAGVGASIDGDAVIASAAGSATVSGVGNSVAAAAGSAGGQATVGGAGASIVAAVGEAAGIATCNASGVGQIGGSTDPYRPARFDDDQDTRKRPDEGQDVRARYDDSQDTRKRVDEAA